jgi:hypothetical protein
MYFWGVIFAVLAGICNYAGLILQKLAVNEVEGGASGGGGAGRAGGEAGRTGAERGGFFARLLRRPLWVLGLVLEIGAGTVFFLLAQVYTGPALIPGLMASGLIVLALGSAWILREPLAFADLLGIVSLVAAAVLLGLSHLDIDLAAYDVLDAGFLKRAALFSLVVLGLFLALLFFGRRKRHGLYHAACSGLLFVLSNFWVGPFTGTVLRLFRGRFSLPLAVMFAFTSAALVLTNLFGIAELQRAFRVSRASVAVPVQILPTQIAPALVYLLVFRLRPPSGGAFLLFVFGAVLIVASSFLLGGSQERAREGASEQRSSAR